MWLEYKHQTFVWIFFRGGQRSADLCRMMSHRLDVFV